MSILNSDIPFQLCFVKNTFLYQDPDNKELTECWMFGVKSQIGRPLLFHCYLPNGAVFWSLPICAFVHDEQFDPMADSEEERLKLLEVWDCESDGIAVNSFTFLRWKQVDYRAKNGNWYSGRYLFSLDNYPVNNHLGYSDHPDAKVFHFLELDNGNYALSPNNCLRWHNTNFGKSYDLNNPPKYKPRQYYLFSEDEYQNKTAGEDEQFFYQFKEESK